MKRLWTIVGVRDVAKNEPVDANTRFIAASNTKALTTLLLAELVDEGKLRWDEKVVEAYPAFKMGNPEVTRQAEIKHLICACTGVPREDFEWLFNFQKQTPKSQVDLLANIQPTTKFGETFQYSNSMAAAAGYIAGLLRGLEAEGCLRLASALGASCVRAIGTTTGVFTRAECDEFLQRNELKVERF